LLDILKYEDLIGVPYKRNGKSPEEGFDCYWLCWFLRKRIGRPIPEKIFSTFRVLRSGEVEKFETDFVKSIKPVPYWIVYFRLGDLKVHVGLVLKDCRHFIEVDEVIGVHTEKLSVPWARHSLVGFYNYECA